MDQGKHVVVGVCGGIAAYKACQVVSSLKKQGVSVDVIMTKHATEFVAPLTFETLSNRPVSVDMFKRSAPWDVEHIALAKKADVFLILPATANVMAKMTHGIADDMLSTTVLATTAPVLIAPAMNENMWANVATQRNVQTLKERGMHFIGPGRGDLACGDEGVGRMEEPDVIVAHTMRLLQGITPYSGKKVLVTAGPTREQLDPVRYLSNDSSGKMGCAIAQQAWRMGAEVTLVHGPISIPLPEGVSEIRIKTTEELLNVLQEQYPLCDVLFMAAAPADFKPSDPMDQKIKKTEHLNLNFRFEANPDILQSLVEKKQNQVTVGFAAETEDAKTNAQDKLLKKGLDMIVANDVSKPGAGFSVDTNIVSIYRADGYEKDYPLMSKQQVADVVLDEAAKLF